MLFEYPTKYMWDFPLSYLYGSITMHNHFPLAPCSQSLARPLHSCRKFGHTYFGLCGPMDFSYDNENKCMKYYVHDYTGMCWVYLLKVNLKLSKHLGIFVYGLDMKHNHTLALFIPLMEYNVV